MNKKEQLRIPSFWSYPHSELPVLTLSVVPPAGYMPNDLVLDGHGSICFSDFRGISTEPQGGSAWMR